jgi:vancomycin resistance protein VanW
VALGEYLTSLRGRTWGQKHNARLAAQRLNGAVIPAGEVLSFNRTVGPWTADRGYLRAPVSYDGELLAAWGGGVCQTSTTVYNAALLAGLEIVERHRHEYPPRYVPPGRDAAVAYPAIDLALRNPYPWPVRLVADAAHDTLRVSVFGAQKPAGGVAVTEEVRSVIPATAVVQTDDDALNPHRVLNPGQTGFEVHVFRTYHGGRESVRRELVSSDYYPPVNRVVRAGTAGNGG